MPFEASLPLVIACLAGAAGALVAWLRAPSRGLFAAAVLLTVAGVGALVADIVVVTDREHLLDLFARLARAAERQDIATIMAAVDPDLHPLRAECERILKQVHPTEVRITRIDVEIAPGAHPPEAVVHMIVRITGNVIDKGTTGTAFAGVKALLRRKDGRWLVRDAEAEQIRPGQR